MLRAKVLYGTKATIKKPKYSDDMKFERFEKKWDKFQMKPITVVQDEPSLISYGVDLTTLSKLLEEGGVLMNKFYWHRGSLKESLSTEITINDFEELYQVLKEYLLDFGIHLNEYDIDIKFYGFDDRIKEKRYIVNITGYGVVGWLNNDLKTTQNDKYFEGDF